MFNSYACLTLFLFILLTIPIWLTVKHVKATINECETLRVCVCVDFYKVLNLNNSLWEFIYF